MTFRVGQKVVRIGFKKGECMFSPGKEYSFPEMGEICTVATINHWPWATLITLLEHDNRHLIGRHGSKYEPGFDAKCFRPVVERKTSIEVFTRMLTDQKVNA